LVVERADGLLEHLSVRWNRGAFEIAAARVRASSIDRCLRRAGARRRSPQVLTLRAAPPPG
jgi:hypothetical protein